MRYRLISFLSIFSLFLSFPLIQASATAKAGGVCTKVGATAIAGGKKYTCVKSGKKIFGVKEFQQTKP